MRPDKPRRLGRGLEALLGTTPLAQPASAPSDQNELQRIPLASIRPNPYQPRRDFSDAELQELRASLQASGMLQPVVVRRADHGFELISGERRFRAATQLGWHEVPALVRSADERTMLTLALIENLQRADLNSIEEARGYERLQREFNLTHQQIADAVGKERSTVTNLLRLLSLPEEVQHLLEQDRLSMGHARALLPITDARLATRIARDIATQDLSVRETERRVRAVVRTPPTSEKQSARPGKIPNAPPPATIADAATVRQFEDRLRRYFQTDAHVRTGQASGGTIELVYYSKDDFVRLIDLLLGAPTVGD